MSEVGMDHDTEAFEFLEDSVHGRSAGVRSYLLDGARKSLNTEVLRGRNESVEDGSLDGGDAATVRANHF